MKRSKRHRVKQELPETSTSQLANQKEHDLAYYIHDRVELMHQVFSVLKPKELRAMAPECVRHISVNDLQELCMEELLGISSKRLCAILDGASPPSDTESSSDSEQLETISLDSISSDEEILSQVCSKKSKKHKHRSKSKPKKRKCKDKADEDKDTVDRSRRAGLTVLELLELQARARAIRAQLQQEQASAGSKRRPSESVKGSSSGDEVEIKEVAAEVVEISSEDEKPNIQNLEERIAATHQETTPEITSNAKTITKKVNDLVITVPKTNTARKIKLKRNNKPISQTCRNTPEKGKTYTKTSGSNSAIIIDKTSEAYAKRKQPEVNSRITNLKSSVETKVIGTLQAKKSKEDVVMAKGKSKDKRKKRKRDMHKEKDGSDHDEITLQLSDTEKMDLLENLEGKQSKICSDSEDSNRDSSDAESMDVSDEDINKKKNISETKNSKFNKLVESNGKANETESIIEIVDIEKKANTNDVRNRIKSPENKVPTDLEENTNNVLKQVIRENKVTIIEKNVEAGLLDVENNKVNTSKGENEKSQTDGSKQISEENDMEPTSNTYKIIAGSEKTDNYIVDENIVSDKSLIISEAVTILNEEEHIQNVEKIHEKNKGQSRVIDQEISKITNSETLNNELNLIDKVLDKEPTNSELLRCSETTLFADVSHKEEVEHRNKEDLTEKSDGELSDRDSSEVEASDIKPDVVYISDDEEQEKKKKKKKDKKNKSDKKSKKKKDFRDSVDQNFYIERNKNVTSIPCSSEKEMILISEVTHIDDSNMRHDNVMMKNIEEEKFTSGTKKNELEEVKNEETKHYEVEILNRGIDFGNDMYEILELSDDSSCYEVEDISISKEPTAKEIEALTAKVDEIDRSTHVDKGIQEDKETEDLDKVSWKDRYLKSSKVKKVLTTANIINAMRKKNLGLKKILHDCKKQNEIEKDNIETVKVTNKIFEDGSIEQYNTLETSTKYVDPVKEVIETNNVNVTEIDNGSKGNIADNSRIIDSDKSGKDTVTKEMKKEAKQLLKMYKMLLKYNDMSKQRDPSKRKKKKKKSKDKDKSVANHAAKAT